MVKLLLLVRINTFIGENVIPTTATTTSTTSTSTYDFDDDLDDLDDLFDDLAGIQILSQIF